MYAAVTGSALQWMLAVQAAPQVEMTPAKTLAGLLLLTVVMAGLGMSLSWLMQITRGQHPLPQARRSTLRTPPMAVLWTTLLTIPLSALAVISSLDALTARTPANTIQPAANTIEQPNNPGAPTARDAAAAADNDASTSADAAAEPEPQPDQNASYRGILASILMNVVLVLILGLVIRSHTQAQRQTAQSLIETASEPQPDQQLRDEPLHVPTELHYACSVFLISVLPSMLLRLLLVVVVTQLTGSAPDSNPLLEILNSDAGPQLMLLIAFAAVVVAPIAEELQFRVVLLGGLQQRGWQWTGMLLSSTLFTLAHGFPDCIALVPLTAALCYTWHRRRSYLTCVLVHCLFNLFNILLAVLVLF
jgi:hypothetical protein